LRRASTHGGPVVVLSGVAGPSDRESRSELVGQGCTSITGIHINDMALFFVAREFAALQPEGHPNRHRLLQ
jgi:hypothetical protein